MNVVSRRRTAATVAVWLLVFASVVSWRKGVLYAGGTDPVVLAKAAVAVLAAVGAALVRRSTAAPRPFAVWPVLLVLAVVGVSLVGALADGSVAANAVLVARIALLAGTVLTLVSTASAPSLLASMLTAMALTGITAALTGVPAYLAGGRGRLGGGLPPLEPNEIATLLLPPAIGLMFLVVRRGVRPGPVVGLLALTGLIVATGSRTALVMLVVAAVVMVLVERRLTAGTSALLLVGALGAYVVLAFSSVLSELALRGEGLGQLLTLNSRTISWSAVLETPQDTWAWWVGRGLSVKSIAVVGQYWKTQVFDSSWISSIAQDGVIGTALLAAYAVGTLVAAPRIGRVRALAAALTITIVLRSFVENGLIESSSTFTVFFTVAVLSWSASPTPRAQPRSAVTARAAERVVRSPRELVSGSTRRH